MQAFPKLLSSQIAFDIAHTILEGFNRHYRLFSEISARAKQCFEQQAWLELQQTARERIDYYDIRVHETVDIIDNEYVPEELTDDVLQEVKLHYIGLLTNHLQPELAETFFNTVITKILHRNYFNNDFIFVRSAVSTEYLENTEQALTPTFRAYYLVEGTTLDNLEESLINAIERIIHNFQLNAQYEDLTRDTEFVVRAIKEEVWLTRIEPNFQIQVLSSLFYRNKAAYVVARIINGGNDYPMVIPIMWSYKTNKLRLDTVLLRRDQVQLLFSFARAYFMVDMTIPSAYVQFIRNMMPSKPRAEIYSMLGLQKQGKTLFYRDLLYHLGHSSDKFDIAPGIKGLVMLVFALPSFNYVFKLIKDNFPPPKETSRELIMSKYRLVKQHDRVGRMADTWEYSQVAFSKSRLSEALITELKLMAPSQIEDDGENIIIKHLYIERRMTPLNIYLTQGTQEQLEHGVVEYGHAIKDLVAANIFPGDMLWKNFGVTRGGRVVFYDYDEIEYITDCNFRKVPEARNEEDEMSSEPWYSVGPHDVFPETFGTFLLGDLRVREAFLKHHADLLEAKFWQSHKDNIKAGYVHDVFPYPQSLRFKNRYSTNTSENV
ncbi:bifunctional isocitrate dehydrogenase kinase/phosphatase [Ampullimonas aquatilis]|uniref:bifunctional isocitrate dehydrogenase kinase/phosphatase n=1 Tax=Ampullimonas aquatilis TaxID=1341549 RepID=UPI003C75280F